VSSCKPTGLIKLQDNDGKQAKNRGFRRARKGYIEGTLGGKCLKK
jgi:hypothetical protein